MTRAFSKRLLPALVCASALAAAACGKDSSTTTSPTTTTTTTSTELFSGTLSPKGSTFYSFSVTNAGDVAVTLASLASSRIGPALPVGLTVGIGVPSGFGCSTTSSVVASPGLTAQLTASGAKDNIYCINLSDPGVLSGDTLFVIRIVHT